MDIAQDIYSTRNRLVALCKEAIDQGYWVSVDFKKLQDIRITATGKVVGGGAVSVAPADVASGPAETSAPMSEDESEDAAVKRIGRMFSPKKKGNE